MNEIIAVFFFLFGLIFGSFYNVVGLRVPKNQSIVYPNSHCTKCKHELAWFELIPVLSYLFLRGKCRKCGLKISPIYPIIEALTGFLFAFSYVMFGWSLELIIAILFISLLVIITVSDLAYMLIPDKILLFFLIPMAFLRFFITPLTPWWDAILGPVIGFAVLYLLAVVSKGGMGGGDIKLFFVIGIVLGLKATLMTLFLASFFGSLFGIGQMLLNKFQKRTPVPFGPFISLAAVICYFYTDDMINWYIQQFLT